MKFYSTLLAIPVIAASMMPSQDNFKSNPPQKIVVAEQITLSAEKVNPPTDPEPVPHRGVGRR